MAIKVPAGSKDYSVSQAPTKNIPYLDGWRGLAIVLVLVSHFGPRGHGWLGLMGVYLFFVLSGLLMSQLLFVKRVELPTFFARRISRIVPTFWLFIAVMAIYTTFFRPVSYPVSLTELASTLFFLRTYLPAGMDIWADQWPIGHVWSLNVEEHSYVYLALGALFCRKGMKAAAPIVFLATSVAAVLAINIFYSAHPPDFGSPWYLRSEAGSLALLAAAAAYISRARLDKNASLALSRWMPVLTFVIAVACCSTYAHRGVDRTIAPLCLAYSIVYLDQVPVLLRRWLSGRVLRWFGTCSFSLYLWQQPFYLSIVEHNSPPLVMGFLAIAVGAFSYYFVEKPLRLALNRWWTGYLGRKAIYPVSTH